jgi:hypothetical protein
VQTKTLVTKELPLTHEFLVKIEDESKTPSTEILGQSFSKDEDDVEIINTCTIKKSKAVPSKIDENEEEFLKHLIVADTNSLIGSFWSIASASTSNSLPKTAVPTRKQKLGITC